MANGTRTCSIEGCGRPFLAREMCSTHYSRWRKQGGQPRPKAFISRTERRCSKCEAVKHPSEFYSSGGWCAECHRAHSRRNYVPTRLPLPACYCVECGEKFRPFRRTDITCTRNCADQRARRFGRLESNLTRAMRRLVQVEVVSSEVVFDRDDWICQICHEDIPRDSSWPDALSASLDHILPLSRGGEHSYVNCQASHLGCNRSKGAKVVG